MSPGFRALGARIARPFALAAAVSLATAAHAGYPERPVRAVVGFATGGADIAARTVAQKLSQRWGQSVMVANKQGAAGNIGADLAAEAPGEGYALLLAVNSYTINTTVYRNLGWDLQRDFAPIARYAASPMVVAVNEKLPVRNLRELVSYAKAHPDKLNHGSAGAGTAPHLVVEQFLQQTGTSMTHVPYKGSAPPVTALLADDAGR